MDDDEIWNLLALHLTGEMQPTQLVIFNQLLEGNLELKYRIETISNWWNAGEESNEGAIRDAWLIHLARLQNSEKIE